jgi:hypothetical protein
MAKASENEARILECLVQDCEVAARYGDAVTEVSRGNCAELDLAAGLQREQASPGKNARLAKACHQVRNLVEGYWQRRIPDISDQPLQLGTEFSWRTGLEADRTDQALSLVLGERMARIARCAGFCADVSASRVGVQLNHHSLVFSGQHQALIFANGSPRKVIPRCS